jgi:PAS domain S-box-containing protein
MTELKPHFAALAVPSDAWPNLSAEARFAGLVETSPTELVLTGRAGRIELVNKQSERMSGYDRTELEGLPLELLVPERFRTRHVDLRRHFASNMSSRIMGQALDLV